MTIRDLARYRYEGIDHCSNSTGTRRTWWSGTGLRRSFFEQRALQDVRFYPGTPKRSAPHMTGSLPVKRSLPRVAPPLRPTLTARAMLCRNMTPSPLRPRWIVQRVG